MKSRTIPHWRILQVDDSFLLHTTRTAYHFEPSSSIPHQCLFSPFACSTRRQRCRIRCNKLKYCKPVQISYASHNILTSTVSLGSSLVFNTSLCPRLSDCFPLQFGTAPVGRYRSISCLLMGLRNGVNAVQSCNSPLLGKWRLAGLAFHSSCAYNLLVFE
jgi:hypothetical protein